MKKTALISGAARGIGFAIAENLAKEGYAVIGCDISKTEDIPETIAKFNSLGMDYFKCNITDETDKNELISYIRQKYGRLDVLVNNAGVAPNVRTDILEVGKESFDRVIEINLKGTFFMCQTFSNLMIKMKGENLEDYTPRIVNISSCSAYTSSPARGEYCISKAGISMITLLFADRLAEFGIPVFEVRPGIIKTDMTEGVLKKYEDMIEGGLLPTKRMGLPSDIAGCVKALISGCFDYSTGQVINADGGFHIRRL